MYFRFCSQLRDGKMRSIDRSSSVCTVRRYVLISSILRSGRTCHSRIARPHFDGLIFNMASLWGFAATLLFNPRSIKNSYFAGLV